MTYDTGFVRNGEISRTRFDPAEVRRELTIIRDDLHCTAVQIIGGDPGRLEIAAVYAAELGMEIWFSPYPLELTPDEILALFVDCAERAERIRGRGGEVVFVAGVELSLMNKGFLLGDSVPERLGAVIGRGEQIGAVSARINEFLGTTVGAVREHFAGRLTYCAIPFERVDWTPFDIVSLELIRSAAVADQFREGVRELVGCGKPVAITGFGTATYKDSAERGGRAMDIVEYDTTSGAPIRLTGEYVRDEAAQAADLADVLEILGTEGVDSTFVFLFALENFPHRPDGDPRDDLDLASPGIVKVFEDRRGVTYPDMRWEPKAAFHAVAAHYRPG